MNRHSILALAVTVVAACRDGHAIASTAPTESPNLANYHANEHAFERANADASSGMLAELDPPQALPDVTEMDGMGINSDGQLVGYAQTGAGASVAVSWTADGGLSALSVPPGWGSSYAFTISDSAAITGVAFTATGVPHAVVWRGGVMADLGTLVPGGASYGMGINAAGDVAGFATDAAGLPRAALFRAGRVIDLGTLPGGLMSFGHDVNASGVVVGSSMVAGWTQRAVKWSAAGGMIALPAVPGQRESMAMAINAGGDIAGFATLADNTMRAVLWPRAGGAVVLEGRSAAVTSATDINATGDVAGYGQLPDGSYRAVLWMRRADGGHDMAEMATSGAVASTFGQSLGERRGHQPLHVAGILATPGHGHRAGVWQ